MVIAVGQTHCSLVQNFNNPAQPCRVLNADHWFHFRSPKTFSFGRPSARRRGRPAPIDTGHSELLSLPLLAIDSEDLCLVSPTERTSGPFFPWTASPRVFFAAVLRSPSSVDHSDLSH